MDQEKFKQLLSRVDELRRGGSFDLSLEEDLSIAVMNLVSLEEHFFFTGEKTEKSEYFSLLQETREIRKSLLGRMIPAHEGETWCISKHLLAASMRVMEVGTKLLGDGKKEEAEEMFKKAYKIYAMFWGLRLKLIDVAGVKKIKDGQLNVHDKSSDEKEQWTVEDIVEKLVDCCDE